MSKSWKEIRKTMEEDFLCQKLHGRIQYFFTTYHNAPDEYGRFAIRFDSEEIFQAHPYNEKYYDKFYREVNDSSKAELLAIETGKSTSFFAMHAIQDYQIMQPKEAIKSENYLLRAFAILDRRIGKRALMELAEFYQLLPEWLRSIYEIRFMVEGISIRNKAKLLLSADGDVGLYEVNDDILRDFDTLLSEFKPPRCYDESDFVEFIKRERGSESIRFIKNVGCYPAIESDYENVVWHNL